MTSLLLALTVSLPPVEAPKRPDYILAPYSFDISGVSNVLLWTPKGYRPAYFDGPKFERRDGKWFREVWRLDRETGTYQSVRVPVLTQFEGTY